MAKQFSARRGDHIEYPLWLIFDERGGARMARGRPTTGRYEKAIALTVTLPISVFKDPEYRVTLSVVDDRAPPAAIDIVAARDALKGALGVDIDLQVVS